MNPIEIVAANIELPSLAQAVHSGDAASVERFFKIFPRLNLHEEGIIKFGKYLSSQISSAADTNFKASMEENSKVWVRHVQKAMDNKCNLVDK